MILLTFDKALTPGDRERIKAAFANIGEGEGQDRIIVVEEATVTSQSATALTFSGIIS